MNSSSTPVLLVCLGLFVQAGCANLPHKTSYTDEQATRQVTNAAAQEVKAHNFVEINFNQASSALSKSATSSLDAAVKQAKQSGEIYQVIVLSWSDGEFPSKKMNKLSKNQRQLAEKRNASVKRYFDPMSGVSVDTYNMAERPSTLSQWFNTTDTKLKNSLTAAGLPTTGDELQYPSKASHSVILFKVN